MKSKKIFGRKQVVMAGLIVTLAAAVWLNMKYSSGAGGFISVSSVSSTKNLGDTQYVATVSDGETVETAAGEADYFTTVKADREESRNEAIALLKETADNASATEDTKKAATDKINEIAQRIEKESAIETLVKSKGFEEAVAVIGDDNVTVVVKAEELLSSQTLQIQDVVISQTEISLDKIKIVAIK